MHNMRKISDAQKAAQKRYDQKTHMISIKYTPKDEDEYYMLQNYLSHSGEKHGVTINQCLKIYKKFGV